MVALLVVSSVLTGALTLGAGMVNEDLSRDEKTRKKALWIGLFSMLATIALAYGAGRVS